MAKPGWSPIPVPHRSKNPGFKNWGQLRLTEDTLADHFNGQPQNVGVLLGDRGHSATSSATQTRTAQDRAAERDEAA